MESRLSQPVHTVTIDETEDEISLGRIFGTLWSYRRVIEVGVAIVMGVFVMLALAGFMLLPRERLSSIGFRLLFDGVDDAKYPNNTKFATSDLISTPVLTEVYFKNDLGRYISSFEKFKNSVFIRDANRDLELLDLEYAGRLADQKLATVDRDRIESEYKDKRRSLTAPFYALTMRRNEWLTTVPPALTEKVLKDTLSTWAQQVDTKKGALKYNIPMYTRASIPLDLIEHEDYLIAADVLRSKTVGMTDTMDQIARLPGVSAFRAGPDHLALGEIRASLNDTLRFRLMPLIATITQSGATTDAKRLRAYVENQLAQAKARQAEQQRRADTLQSSLATYQGEKAFSNQTAAVVGAAPRPGQTQAGVDQSVIPQVSESFLDRIMDLSKQNTDVKYRQDMVEKIVEEGMLASALGRDIAYYTELLQHLPAGGPGNGEAIRASMKGVYDSVAKTLDQINMFYSELSDQNLNSQGTLYAITDPFSDFTQREFGWQSMVMYGALTFLMALFFVPLGCLVHHTTIASRRRAPTT
jgi:hypothetical protein